MRKVAKIDIETKEVIKIYDSLSEAAKENNINQGNLSKVMIGKSRSNLGGFMWRPIKKVVVEEVEWDVK